MRKQIILNTCYAALVVEIDLELVCHVGDIRDIYDVYYATGTCYCDDVCLRQHMPRIMAHNISTTRAA
jgi:hypothetical protein